jgi:tetratricopeptide (TPR) repeat protein
MLNPEVLTFWEHFHASGAWDKTHETGTFLQQTRFLLVMEYGDELWLAPLIPSDWLKDGRTVAVARAPTRFGPVSYRIQSQLSEGRVDAEIDPPARNAPKAVVLRLRLPEGRRLRAATVNGQSHANFDAAREVITIPSPGAPKAGMPRGEKVLRQALDLQPDFADGRQALGLLLARQGRKEEALEELEKAASLRPEDPHFAYVHGVSLNSTGRLERALQVLERALEIHPTNQELLFALATINRDRGARDQAWRYAQQLRSLAPDRPDFQELVRQIEATQR